MPSWWRMPCRTPSWSTARTWSPHATDNEMMELAARIRAYAGVMKGGPLCFVVATPEMLDYTRRYINLATAERPMQICKTVAEAKAWLAKQKA